MCEDSHMDDFTDAYLRFDATLALVPGPLASLGPDTSPAYPAGEVAAAISHLRSVRGVSRRPPRDEQGAIRANWNELRWRWREADREIIIGFIVRHASAPDATDIWAGSPLSVHCLYEDVARLALALARRLPALRLCLDDQPLCTPRDFIESVALARLAPALASADATTHERALAAQRVYTDLLAIAPQPPILADALAAAPFTTLFEDARLLAVNKPAGVVTHPTYKHPDGTLTDAVFAQQEALGWPRPWLLHRLDKQTSGVVLFARGEQARRSLASQFAQHIARKRYLALVIWPPSSAPDTAEGEIDAPLARDPLDRRRVIVAPDGQPSRTRYRRLGVTPGYALLQAEPVTGRTHQIRAHLASIGAPLVGDVTYLPDAAPASDLAPRVMLHAWRLDLRYPGSDAPWSVTAPPPDDFHAAADVLGLGGALRDALVDAGD